MKLVAKEDQLFLTYGKSYESIMIRLIGFGKAECNIIDDIGTNCWHKLSSFYTLEEWRDIKLEELGI